MSDSETQIGNLKSEIGNPADVWERLRESMEQINGSHQRARDPETLALKLAQRAKLLRGRPSAQGEQSTTLFLTFSSGQERFGVRLSDVVEIQALDHYSPVPQAPPFIVGVIPWRGAILALFDLGRLFGIPEAGIGDYHVCVIVEAVGRRIALVAREVEDILGIPAEQVKPAPDLPGHAPPEWVAGVHDGNRLLLCLERLLQDERFLNANCRLAIAN